MAMDETLRALASPTRRAILEPVWDAERSSSEIADKVGATRPATSQHLKVLRDAGLVRVRADGTSASTGSTPSAWRRCAPRSRPSGAPGSAACRQRLGWSGWSTATWRPRCDPLHAEGWSRFLPRPAAVVAGRDPGKEPARTGPPPSLGR